MGTDSLVAEVEHDPSASDRDRENMGSEPKAMVRVLRGYAFVGADVDSGELWISSCMGDAHFGLHGATTIGWMTLEDTKPAGTDSYSKTASILAISRDQANLVFYYSRIYGAGTMYAVLLLLQANAAMQSEEAKGENLYTSTKAGPVWTQTLVRWDGELRIPQARGDHAVGSPADGPAHGCGITAPRESLDI